MTKDSSSLIEELARKLSADYSSAPSSRKVASIHLFAIANANRLAGVSKADLAERAGLPRSYGTEIGKGVVLAEYVSIMKTLA